MININTVNLIGRLAKEPNSRSTSTGKSVCSFTLAVQNDFDREKADFINCTAWGKTAELITQYVKKGHKMGLQGRISVRSWDDNGETKWTTEVVAEKIEFLESKK